MTPTCCRSSSHPKPHCRLHGCEKGGRRAPCGCRNGNFRQGSYSWVLTAEQRAAAWAAFKARVDAERLSGVTFQSQKRSRDIFGGARAISSITTARQTKCAMTMTRKVILFAPKPTMTLQSR